MSRKQTPKKTEATAQISELLSIAEMQARLNVSRATVMRLKERIPHYRIGDRVLFDWKDVEAYLAARRVEPSRVKPYRASCALLAAQE